MTTQGRPGYYNVPTVTEIGVYIDDGTTATNLSIITMTPQSPVAIKTYTTSTNIPTTRLTISTTSMSSQNIGYIIKLRYQSRSSTRDTR